MSTLLVLSFLMQGLLSQPAVAAEQFSFNACIDLVKQNNADLQAAEANLKAIEYQEKAAYGNFLPEVTANLGYTRGNTNYNTDFSTTQNVGSFTTSSTRNYSATLSGSWNLFSGLSDKGTLL